MGCSRVENGKWQRPRYTWPQLDSSLQRPKNWNLDLCRSRLTCLSSRVRKPCLHMPSHNIEAHVDHLERFARIEHRDIHEEQDLRHDDSAGYLHGGEKRPSWFISWIEGKNRGPSSKIFIFKANAGRQHQVNLPAGTVWACLGMFGHCCEAKRPFWAEHYLTLKHPNSRPTLGQLRLSLRF